MQQVIGRTIRRRLGREELWNGNVEPPLWTILAQRDHVVRWAWRTHHESSSRVAALHEARPTLAIVRLRGRSAVGQWLDDVLPGGATPLR